LSSELASKITDDNLIKKACQGNITFFEQAVRDNILHEEVLLAIVKGNLDQTDPRFKELVS
jgi:hypothetical protein